MKKSFILYQDQCEVVSNMEDIEAGRLFKAIYSYENGVAPEFSDRTVEIAFQFFKTHLDRDSKKWEEVREKRSEAGKVGGKKTASKTKQNKQMLELPSKPQQTQANQAVSESVIVSVNYLEYINILKNKDALWATALEKGLGLRPKKVWALLDLFKAHLETQGTSHKTLESFKNHFHNWLKKEDQNRRLEQHKINRKGAL